MNTEEMLGLAATGITLVYTCFGLPVQIYKNHKQKTTAGLSLFNLLMTLLTFTSWCVYAFCKQGRDWYVIASNAPGALFVAIILLQFRVYKRPRVN